jgi:hypothetical protein
LTESGQALLDDWEHLLQMLPPDLEATARQTGAFQRPRQIRSASDLLRLVLMYALRDASLRLLGVWACLQGLGYLSDVAVLNRLRHTVAWLTQLVGHLLEQRCRAIQRLPPVRLRIMDATVISRPGSTGTDWRVHLGLSLWPLGVDGVEITDAHGGESLTRLAAQPDEIRVADRGYAFVASLAPLLAAALALVVRIHWQNLTLENAAGQRGDRIAWLRSVHTATELPVWLPTPLGRFALRLIGVPLPPPAARRARARLRKFSQKKGRTPSPDNLFAAGFLLLVTNLSAAAWPVQQVLWLYRFRWQIELAIKRFKSLLHLDQFRAQDPHLAQAYLLGKLLSILLMDQLTDQVMLLQPDWFVDLERPVSLWRLTQLLWISFGHGVFGHFYPQRVFRLLPWLRRYFCGSPRARPQQLAWARAFLEVKADLFSPLQSS